MFLSFAVLLGTAVLQTAIMPRLSLWGVKPDLMLLVVISWSLLRGTKEGATWALGGGLLLDLLSGGPFGTATLALMLSSLVAGLGELNLFRGSLWLPLAAGLLASAVYNASFLVMLQVFGRPVPWGSELLLVTLPSMALNALVIYPTYWSVRSLHRRTRSKTLEW
jgi:rod shape-determining protein MreD